MLGTYPTFDPREAINFHKLDKQGIPIRISGENWHNDNDKLGVVDEQKSNCLDKPEMESYPTDEVYNKDTNTLANCSAKLEVLS